MPHWFDRFARWAATRGSGQPPAPPLPAPLGVRVTRREGLKLAGGGLVLAAAGGAAQHAGAAATAGCDSSALERCLDRAALKGVTYDLLCRFERPVNRRACRTRAATQRAVLARSCRLTYCTCPAGTTRCGGEGSGLCCDASERCDVDVGEQARCVPASEGPAASPPPMACASDEPTLASLDAASEALQAGAMEVALSPGGCLRYRRSFTGAALTSELLLAEGKPLWSFTHSGSTSSSEGDFDLDGFAEWRGTLTRGARPESVLEDYAPDTHRLRRRRTRRRSEDGKRVRSKWEEDDGGGLRTVAEFDSPTYQEHRPSGGRAALSAFGCSRDDEALIRDRLRDAMESQGLPCLRRHRVTDIVRAIELQYARGIQVVCDPEMNPPARADEWDDHPFSPRAFQIRVNPTKFRTDPTTGRPRSPGEQSGIMLHELTHLIGEHHYELGLSPPARFGEFDRFLACEALCGNPTPLTTKCHCATCLQTTVCDPRCSKYKDCDPDMGGWCPCICRKKYYPRRVDCEVECPSGLCCFASRCKVFDVRCRR